VGTWPTAGAGGKGDLLVGDVVVAGVVTYNPDLLRLEENLTAIVPQVDLVVIFDNGSSNAGDVIALAAKFSSAIVHASPVNAGIAAALNWIATESASQGASWLLTLDQDSVAAPTMVTHMWGVVDDSTPMVTPFIIDRNKMSVDDYACLNLPPVQYYRQAARRGAITSGSLVKLSVLKEVGAFDEAMFIDYVDYDLNQRLLLAGHQIARDNGTYLLHEVGMAEKTWLWVPRVSIDGKWHFERFFAFGHSAGRCYYKARNRVIFTRKYWRAIGFTHEGVWQIPGQVALTILFEKGKLAKLGAFARGFWDGLRVPL
jgi:rhamnosyltransferase